MTIDLLEMCVELTKAHLTQNRMSHRDVPQFIREIHTTLETLRQTASTTATATATASPAIGAPAAAAPTASAEAAAPAASAPVGEESSAPVADLTPSAEEVAEAAPVAGDRAFSSKIAAIRDEDISDPAYAGLDPWLAKRISPKLAKKLDAGNNIHPTVFPDKLICLEDGQPVTLLRAYVKNRFGLSFNEYIEKWNLPDDYPTAPPAYVERKRALAKSSGLGVTTRANRERPRTQAAEAAPAPARAKAAAAPKAEQPKAARGGKSAGAKATGGKASTAKAGGRGRARSATEVTAGRGEAARGERRKLSLFPDQPAAQ